MRLGIACDHGGYALKGPIQKALEDIGHEVMDFGATGYNMEDDYPDFVAPLARAVASSQVERGIAICGSGVGACVVANKIPGVRSALITDVFSAHQGVEDDRMNLICLGARVVGYELAWDLTQAFLSAQYTPVERFERRLAKIAAIERQELMP